MKRASSGGLKNRLIRRNRCEQVLTVLRSGKGHASDPGELLTTICLHIGGQPREVLLSVGFRQLDQLFQRLIEGFAACDKSEFGKTKDELPFREAGLRLELKRLKHRQKIVAADEQHLLTSLVTVNHSRTVVMHDRRH